MRYFLLIKIIDYFTILKGSRSNNKIKKKGYKNNNINACVSKYFNYKISILIKESRFGDNNELV